MQRVYNVDLLDLWRGRLTWRRLDVLVSQLPPESALKTAMRDALPDSAWDNVPEPVGHGVWSHSDMLLALIADRLGVAIWQTAALNRPKNAPAPALLDPVRRPGVRARAASTPLTAAGRALLESRRREFQERQASG